MITPLSIDDGPSRQAERERDAERQIDARRAPRGFVPRARSSPGTSPAFVSVAATAPARARPGSSPPSWASMASPNF